MESWCASAYSQIASSCLAVNGWYFSRKYWMLSESTSEPTSARGLGQMDSTMDKESDCSVEDIFGGGGSSSWL